MKAEEIIELIKKQKSKLTEQESASWRNRYIKYINSGGLQKWEDVKKPTDSELKMRGGIASLNELLFEIESQKNNSEEAKDYNFYIEDPETQDRIFEGVVEKVRNRQETDKHGNPSSQHWELIGFGKFTPSKGCVNQLYRVVYSFDRWKKFGVERSILAEVDFDYLEYAAGGFHMIRLEADRLPIARFLDSLSSVQTIDRGNKLETELNEIKKAAREVMEALDKYGEKIVSHLLDNDDNAGQRLRDLIDIKIKKIEHK